MKFGPYHPPRTRPGQRLFCENLGTVKVLKFSDGEITWPLCTVGEKGGPAYILCGDLVKAVKLEAAEAVARAWGVDSSTVSRWRRILGVERFNRGTHELFLKYQGKALTPETGARGREKQTPDRWTAWGRKRHKDGRTRKRKWTEEEDSLVGTMSDDQLALRLGCSTATVAHRRRELRIPTLITSPQMAASIKAARKRLLSYSPKKLIARRLELGLFQTQVAERCGWATSAMYQRLESPLQTRSTRKMLERVAQALECKVEDFLVTRGRRPRDEGPVLSADHTGANQRPTPEHSDASNGA